MMQVCLHFPTAYSKPVGVWWWNVAMNAPKSYYLPGQEKYQALALGVLGASESEQQWNAWAQRMADRTPHSSSFEVDTISTDPKQYLNMIRKVKP